MESTGKRLPEIAVFGPPAFYRKNEKEFSSRFRVLRTWDSHIPLPQLLASEAWRIEAILTSANFCFTANVIASLPSLRLIITTSRGVDHIDLTECRRRGITVTKALIHCLKLGKQGVIVNISRGPVIDEKALIHCLKLGEIAGAGLDVFETEPLFSSELFEIENAVLSPHAAVFTEESFREMFDLIFGNFDSHFMNKPLLNVIPLDQQQMDN